MQPVENSSPLVEEVPESATQTSSAAAGQFSSFQTAEVSTTAAHTTIGNNFGLRKRVNFKLNAEECIEEEEVVQQSVAMRKIYRKTRKKRLGAGGGGGELKKFNSLERNVKNVVFNGTFPIDYPLKSRFESDGSSPDEDEREEEAEAFKTMSMQELVESKNVKVNLAQMRKEFEVSFSEFEKFLAKGRPTSSTFAIDEPL